MCAAFMSKVLSEFFEAETILCRSKQILFRFRQLGGLDLWSLGSAKKIGMNDFLLMSVTFYRHARKYFTIFEDEQLQDVQHCMALLAFPTDTGIF
jgi:hypothetical protein